MLAVKRRAALWIKPWIDLQMLGESGAMGMAYTDNREDAGDAICRVF